MGGATQQTYGSAPTTTTYVGGGSSVVSSSPMQTTYGVSTQPVMQTGSSAVIQPAVGSQMIAQPTMVSMQPVIAQPATTMVMQPTIGTQVIGQPSTQVITT